MQGVKIKEVKPDSEIKTQADVVDKTKEVVDEGKEEVMEEEELEDMPPWMKYLGNDQYEVRTRKAVYILEDIPYDKIIRAKARTTGGKDSPQAMDRFELALLAESTVKPKVTEAELREKRGSELMRLRAAIYKLYDIASFL